jgi:hypothetical protein
MHQEHNSKEQDGEARNRNTALTCTYTKGFDMNGTLSTQNASGVQSDPVSRVGRSVLVAIGISLFAAPSAAAPDEIKQYVSAKEYAAHLLQDTKQYKCLASLYGKESAWDETAQSGSHYGIPQGRSEYLRTADKYEQVRWGLSYIENRYGSPCKAWEFFQRNNYH